MFTLPPDTQRSGDADISAQQLLAPSQLPAGLPGPEPSPSAQLHREGKGRKGRKGLRSFCSMTSLSGGWR